MNNNATVTDELKIEIEEYEQEQERAEVERGVTLLESWYALLSNVETERGRPIGMPMAMTHINRHPGLKIQELPAYFEQFYDILEEAFAILVDQIKSNPGCLNRWEDDADAELNREIYLNIYILWNQLLELRELEWDVAAEDAHVRLASYVSGADFLVGSEGMIGQLAQIDFEFDEDDARLVKQARLDGVVS